jgi:hypothetical protein
MAEPPIRIDPIVVFLTMRDARQNLLPVQDAAQCHSVAKRGTPKMIPARKTAAVSTRLGQFGFRDFALSLADFYRRLESDEASCA